MTKKNKIWANVLTWTIVSGLLALGVNGVKGAENLFKFYTFCMLILHIIALWVAHIDEPEVKKSLINNTNYVLPPSVGYAVGILWMCVAGWHGWFFTAFLIAVIEFCSYLFKSKLDELRDEHLMQVADEV